MTIMTTDSFLFRDCTSRVLGHQGGQLGKGSCNPLLAFQLEVLWYQDFTGTFKYVSLHYNIKITHLRGKKTTNNC